MRLLLSASMWLVQFTIRRWTLTLELQAMVIVATVRCSVAQENFKNATHLWMIETRREYSNVHWFPHKAADYVSRHFGLLVSSTME